MSKYGFSYLPSQYKIFFGSNSRFKTVAKGRRFGFTRACAIYTVNCLINHQNTGIHTALWVDTINRNIQNYFEKYFIPLLKDLPPRLWSWAKQDKKLYINGAVLHMVGADRPENIEGLGYDLVIINEAGIVLKDSSLWDNSISPMLLDNPSSKAIIGGVPKGKNRFYDLSQNGLKGVKDWEHFSVTAYDNCKFAGKELNRDNGTFEKIMVPTKESLDRLVDELGGKTSPVVRQEIYGEFIDSSSNLLISLDEIERAFANDIVDDSGEVVWSVDVARYGDDKSVIAKRKGNYIHKLKSYFGLNTDEVAREVFTDYQNASIKPNAIFIDSTGVGAGVFDKLQTRALPVREAIMSARAIDKAYKNKRAEMYANLAKKMKLLKIEPNENLKKQSQFIEYFYDNEGKIQIISKDSIKKLYGSSPDELDALAMLFYEPVFGDSEPNLSDDWSGNGW